MVNRDLLKEAIADAKAVKETAIANAKAALEEAFTPMMQEKFAKKIAQLDEEEEDGLKEYAETQPDRDMDGDGDIDAADVKAMGESEIDEIDLEELLRELDEMEENINSTEFPDEPGEHGNVAGQNVPNINEAEEEEEMDYEDEDADGVEDSEDEEIDIENMDESDLKSFIESVIADMVAAGELEGGESEESEESEEVEINERKKQGYDDREDEKLGMKRGKMGSKDLKTTKARRDDAGFEKKKMKENYEMEEDYGMEEKPVNEVIGTAALIVSALVGLAGAAILKTYKSFKDEQKTEVEKKLATLVAQGVDPKEAGEQAVEFVANMQSAAPGSSKYAQPKGGFNVGGNLEEKNNMEAELNEAYQTIKTIQTELQEVNLFNAKLLYTNKIFKAKTLTESQKVKVLAAFDKAASVKEAKLVFETLSEGFKEKKSPVNESLLRGSASRAAGVADKKPILEVNDQFARWQTLAGIKK